MASYSDIAHLWATQAEKGPRKAGNFWRDGVKAGHYGTCVARLVESPAGTVALIMNNHWGTGTAAFINQCAAEARKANIPTFLIDIASNEPGAHAKNLQRFERDALDCEAKIATARSRNWQEDADRIRAEARRYMETFGLSAK